MPLEIVVWIYDYVDNILGIKNSFAKYLKEGGSDAHFSFKYFFSNVSVRFLQMFEAAFNHCEYQRVKGGHHSNVQQKGIREIHLGA